MTNFSDAKMKMKLTLPFAVSAQNRVKDFTEEMEMAAILYNAESNRQKGEGIILKKPDEKLVFITKAAYPLWLVPWTKGTLAFDGLGATKHAMFYDTLPDISAFNKDTMENARTTEAYSVALVRNSQYFEHFTAREEKTIDNLIAIPDFLQDFSIYLSKAESTQKPLITRAVLSFLIEQSEISASIQELAWLMTKLREDVESIDVSMNLLSKTTREKTRTIREDIRETRRKYNKHAAKAKPRVIGKTRQIQEKYNNRIARASRGYERRLQLLNKNRAKHEKMRKHLTTEVNRCKMRIARCKKHKRKRNVALWNSRLKRIEKRLSPLSNNIKNIDENIRNLETAKTQKTSQLRLECDAAREKAAAILRDLAASREAEIKMKQQKATSLEQDTAQIINQMKEMAKSKKAALNEIDNVNMPTRKRTGALVYLPFYLARYEKEGNQRYVIYPPSIVGDMDILTKMKGALGAAKMNAFLQPRSKAITTFLNQLIPLLQQNPMLEKEVTEAGIQESLLRIKELRLGVKRGLEELENEQWISRDEVENFSKILYIYA
jgi:hypothetical protein